MNRGTYRGMAPTVGDYNGLESVGGSWGGNRGRIHVDELRLWGLADGQKNWLGNPTAAARVINTNNQQSVGNAYAPGDQGMIINAISGTTICNGVNSPTASVYNTAGRFRFAQTSGACWAALEMNTIIDNVPGIAVTLPNMIGVTSTAFYVANGATCPVTNTNTWADIQSFPNFGTFNSGTLTAARYQQFQCNMLVNTGATITLRVGYGFADIVSGSILPQFMTNGAGAVTTQVGFDIPALSVAATSIGIRLLSSGTTYTAATGTTASMMQPITINQSQTQVLNYSNGTFSPTGTQGLVHIGGTFSFTTSAQAAAAGAGYSYVPTIQNTSGSTANLGVSIGYLANPTIQAVNATITGSTHIGFSSSPTITQTSSGTLNSANYRHFNVGIATLTNANVTVSQLTGLFINDASVTSSTLTTQVGIDIPALAAGTTNIGIRNASSTVCTSSANQTLAAATTISPNATVVRIIQTSGANITLTATPTISVTNVQDGQILYIINVSTVAGSTFTFQSADTLAGSQLSMAGTLAAVQVKGMVAFVYSSTLSRWVQFAQNLGGHGA